MTNTFQTSHQVRTRNRLPETLQKKFGVEFGRNRIKTSIFCVLLLTIGFSGAPLFYLAKNSFWKWSTFRLWIAYLVCLGLANGSSIFFDGYFLLTLQVAVVSYGIFLLATNTIQGQNDDFADNLAEKLLKRNTLASDLSNGDVTELPQSIVEIDD